MSRITSFVVIEKFFTLILLMDVWKESLDMDNHAVLALYEGPYSIGLSNPAFRRYFSMHPAIPPQWTVSSRSCWVKRRLLYFTALFKLMDKLKPLHDYGERQRLAYGIFGRLKKKPVVPRCVYSLYKWGTKSNRKAIKCFSRSHKNRSQRYNKLHELHRLKTRLPKKVILVSMHGTSLYTNIPQAEGI